MPFLVPDLIETPRLLLRLLQDQDGIRLFDYFSQDCVTRFYDLATFTRPEQGDELLNIWRARQQAQSSIRLALTLKGGNNELIGTCGFHQFSHENNRAEIGYDLHPQYWNQGLMSEAIQALIQYGFETLRLHRIEAFISPEHHASRAVLHKNGMQTEGVLRDYFYEKEVFVDAEILSILRPSPAYPDKP